MSVSKWDPDRSKHIWGNQRAVVSVSKQYRPSSPLTWHDHASKRKDFCFFSAGRGAVFCLGWLCSGASELQSSYRLSWFSCHFRGRASPQNTIFKGCKQVYGTHTPSEKMNVSVVAMPPRNFKNNDYVCGSLHSPPTPECYSGDSWAKTNATVISFNKRQVWSRRRTCKHWFIITNIASGYY